MIGEKWSTRFRSDDEIRSRGAIGNLNDGIEITTQGVRTRLIAWPGNGFQTESVQVLTLAPGEESAQYEYDMSDEAMVCFKGQGEVYLRGEWVQIEPGDIAYFPERVPARSAIQGETRATSCLSIRSVPHSSICTSRQAITIELTAG